MRNLALPIACVLALALPASAAALEINGSASNSPPPGARPSLELSPSLSQPNTGETIQIAVITNGVRAGTPLHWYVAGTNNFNRATVVDASGRATIALRGISAGTDTVVAQADLDGDGNEDEGEPRGVARVRWVPSPTYLAAGVETATSLAGLPGPRRYRSINVQRVRGRVTVQLPSRSGAAASGPFRVLTAAAQLPAGSVIDARRGEVALEAGVPRGNGRARFGDVSGGAFELRQSTTNVELTMARGDFRRSCRSRRFRVVRRLRGTGAVRIRARNSWTTARRGAWAVEDRCDGTRTSASRRRGSLADVRDRVRRRTIRLRAGRSYLARARSARR